jgi:hypothetical protein
MKLKYNRRQRRQRRGGTWGSGKTFEAWRRRRGIKSWAEKRRTSRIAGHRAARRVSAKMQTYLPGHRHRLRR